MKKRYTEEQIIKAIKDLAPDTLILAITSSAPSTEPQPPPKPPQPTTKSPKTVTSSNLPALHDERTNQYSVSTP